MENLTYEYEQMTAAVYEPPVLVEMGEFSTDTLGGVAIGNDSNGGRE